MLAMVAAAAWPAASSGISSACRRCSGRCFSRPPSPPAGFIGGRGASSRPRIRDLAVDHRRRADDDRGELALLASVVAFCVLARLIDHFLFGPLPRAAAVAVARCAVDHSTERTWVTFAFIYAVCATLGFAIGFAIAPTRAIWVSITTLVVMQPDDARNYRRILERVAGTPPACSPPSC